MIVLPVTCPVFVGRKIELEALNDARRALSRSAGSVVLVSGEAGIGKSRLVAQMIRQAGDRRVRHLAITECIEGSFEPLRPIRAICDALLAGASPPTLSAASKRAVARIVPSLEPTARETERADGPVDRADILTGITALLAGIAVKRATIVVLEDIHWADAFTLDFLAHLAGHVAGTRLLIVATYRGELLERNEPLFRAIARMEREGSVRKIALDPLDRTDLRLLIDGALEGRVTVPDATCDDIAERSEGNPFYAEELLKEAVADEASRRPTRLPISIRATIVDRLSLFDEAERRVLAFAAVLGLRFDPAVLAAVMERTIDDLLPTLRRARDADVLVEDPADRAGLRFRHALTRHVIYAELLTFDARRLHQRIVEVLESRDDAGSDFALAEHAAAAGDGERTVRYGERAGRAALAIGAFDEARTCFRRALDAAVDDGDSARLLEQLGFAGSYGNRILQGVEAWEAALAIRKRRKEFSDATRLLVLLVCERYNTGTLHDDGASAIAFVDEHRSSIEPAARSGMYLLIARLNSILCKFDVVDGLLENVDDPASLSLEKRQSYLITKLNRAAFFGRVADWRTIAEELAWLPPINPSPSVDAINACVYHAAIVSSGAHLGEHAIVDASALRSAALAREWHFAAQETFVDAVDAARLFARGRISAARASFDRAARDSTQALANELLCQTAPLLAVALGDDEPVERAISPSGLVRQRERLSRNPASQEDRLALGAHGVWLAARGRVAESVRYLENALGNVVFPSPVFAGIVSFALRHIDAALVPGLTRFADTSGRNADDAAGRATARLASAALARVAGDAEAAVTAARDAATAYERAGYPLYAAHALWFAGDATAALELYVRCEAAGYLEQARESDPVPAMYDLSRRERDVASLIRLGMTNGAIAERMGISVKTVEKHVASMFGKLGVRSRSQIAAHVASSS